MLIFHITDDETLAAALAAHLQEVCGIAPRRYSLPHPPGDMWDDASVAAAFGQIADWIEDQARDGGSEFRLRRAIAFIDLLEPSSLPASSPKTPSLVENGSKESPWLSQHENVCEWQNVVQMLIMAFPEVHWVIRGLHPERTDQIAGAHRFQALHLPDLLRVSEAGYQPLFDPTGLRDSLRRDVSGNIPDSHSLPRRTKLAVAVDDEIEYAYFAAYLAYRIRRRAYAVASYSLLEAIAGNSSQLAPRAAALRDLIRQPLSPDTAQTLPTSPAASSASSPVGPKPGKPSAEPLPSVSEAPPPASHSHPPPQGQPEESIAGTGRNSEQVPDTSNAAVSAPAKPLEIPVSSPPPFQPEPTQEWLQEPAQDPSPESQTSPPAPVLPNPGPDEAFKPGAPPISTAQPAAPPSPDTIPPSLLQQIDISFEDVYLRFTDHVRKVSFSDIVTRDTELPGLSNPNHRIFLTAGRPSRNDVRWAMLDAYVVARNRKSPQARPHFRILLKPFSGIFALQKQAGLNGYACSAAAAEPETISWSSPWIVLIIWLIVSVVLLALPLIWPGLWTAKVSPRLWQAAWFVPSIVLWLWLARPFVLWVTGLTQTGLFWRWIRGINTPASENPQPLTKERDTNETEKSPETPKEIGAAAAHAAANGVLPPPEVVLAAAKLNATQNTTLTAGHSANGRLLAIAVRLVARSDKLLAEARATTDAIHAALLALDAEEYLGHRNPTLSLEAISLKHQAEVKAECLFYGVAQSLQVKERLKELKRDVHSICRHYYPWRRRAVALTATLGVIGELVLLYREYNRFDEEMACLAETRGLILQADIWKFTSSLPIFNWPGRWEFFLDFVSSFFNLLLAPVRLYAHLLLARMKPWFPIMVLLWVVAFAWVFRSVLPAPPPEPPPATTTVTTQQEACKPPGVSPGKSSDASSQQPDSNAESSTARAWEYAFTHAVASFFGLGPPDDANAVVKGGKKALLVAIAAILVGFFHLVILVSHAYTLLSRR